MSLADTGCKPEDRKAVTKAQSGSISDGGDFNQNSAYDVNYLKWNEALQKWNQNNAGSWPQDPVTNAQSNSTFNSQLDHARTAAQLDMDDMIGNLMSQTFSSVFSPERRDKLVEKLSKKIYNQMEVQVSDG